METDGKYPPLGRKTGFRFKLEEPMNNGQSSVLCNVHGLVSSLVNSWKIFSQVHGYKIKHSVFAAGKFQPLNLEIRSSPLLSDRFMSSTI
jgi:hypothetical protein